MNNIELWKITVMVCLPILTIAHLCVDIWAVRKSREAKKAQKFWQDAFRQNEAALYACEAALRSHMDLLKAAIIFKARSAEAPQEKT